MPVVGWSARLADRAGLAEDLDEADDYDVLLTELKAAAVDVACERALGPWGGGRVRRQPGGRRRGTRPTSTTALGEVVELATSGDDRTGGSER